MFVLRDLKERGVRIAPAAARTPPFFNPTGG